MKLTQMRKTTESIQGPNGGGGGVPSFEHVEFGKSVTLWVEMSSGWSNIGV